MKIAVIADPHANSAALQATIEHVETWKPDKVVVVGDLVNRGPRPGECLRLILEKVRTHGWLLVRGNHEDYVISQSCSDAPRSGPAFEVHRPSYWTYLQLNCDVSELQAMPFQQSLRDPEKAEIRFVHASMQGMRVGIFPETCDRSLLDRIGENGHLPCTFPPVVFCAGHTHRPFVRSLNNTLIINAGSAGLPFDLDPRPAYAQLLWRRGKWQADIIRIEYDRAQTERDYYETGYLEDGGPLTRIVQFELATARSLLYSWAEKYQALATAGLITVEESVREYLSSIGL
jgi:predicted phosphodiesterase